MLLKLILMRSGIVVIAVLCLLSIVEPAGAATQAQFDQVKKAIRAHDLRAVQELTRSEPGVLTFRDSVGNFTLLHIACMNADAKIVSFLLTKQLDANAIDRMNMTPVHWAVVARSVETMKALADGGADLHAGDSVDYLLDDAIGMEDIKMVEYLLSKGFSPNFYSMHVNLPLVSAAWVGNTEIIKRLLDAGGKINLQGNQSESAISTACGRGKPEVVKFLLDHGAEPNGNYPIAAEPMVQVLKMDDIESFKLLLAHGYDLHKQQEVAPLCALARFSDNPAFGDLMLSHHADMNVTERRSLATPMQLAVRYQHRKVMKWLMAHGARMDTADPETDEPVTLALKMQDIESMQMLQSRK